MIISIPDELSGEERKQIIEIIPIVYALRLKTSIINASKFLGISRALLLSKIKQYPELRAFDVYSPSTTFEKQFIIRESGESNIMRNLYQYHLRKSMKTFWYVNASEEEKRKFIERLKKLYSIS